MTLDRTSADSVRVPLDCTPSDGIRMTLDRTSADLVRVLLDCTPSEVVRRRLDKSLFGVENPFFHFPDCLSQPADFLLLLVHARRNRHPFVGRRFDCFLPFTTPFHRTHKAFSKNLSRLGGEEGYIPFGFFERFGLPHRGFERLFLVETEIAPRPF
jgi:hypothetical protein